MSFPHDVKICQSKEINAAKTPPLQLCHNTFRRPRWWETRWDSNSGNFQIFYVTWKYLGSKYVTKSYISKIYLLLRIIVKRRMPGLLVFYHVVLSGKKENLCWDFYALLHIRIMHIATIQFDIDSSVVKNIVAMQSCNLANWGKCKDKMNHHHSIAISPNVILLSTTKGAFMKKIG